MRNCANIAAGITGRTTGTIISMGHFFASIIAAVANLPVVRIIVYPSIITGVGIIFD